MAKLICEFEGVRGRNLKLFDTKIVINTKKTVGSLITGNFTDGEKTIFLRDVVGVQFKKSGGLIGYLQFETPSMQMNNKSDNMFSENTFTFQDGSNGVTNELMIKVYEYITDRIEEIKYGTTIITEEPNFETFLTTGFAPQKSYEDDSAINDLDMDIEDLTKEQLWKIGERQFGQIIGQCSMCGKEKTPIMFVELEDFFGKTERNVCFECFEKKDCVPIERK